MNAHEMVTGHARILSHQRWGKWCWPSAPEPALYLARRTTGSLIWAMLIHGLWDLAAFIGSGAVVLSPVLVIANGLLGLTLVAFSLRTTSGRKLEQFGASRLLDA